MADKNKLSEWVTENVGDEEVWSEFFVAARKEETQSGSRVTVTQNATDPIEGTITGKQIKDALSSSASPVIGIVFIVIGAIIAAGLFLLREPMNSSAGFLVIGLLMAAGIAGFGAAQLVKSLTSAPKIRSIASFEQLEPYIEAALTEKVYNEMIAKRKEEHQDKGAAYAGYYCIPARYAAEDKFEKAKSNFPIAENIKALLRISAASLPPEARRLSRKQ